MPFCIWKKAEIEMTVEVPFHGNFLMSTMKFQWDFKCTHTRQTDSTVIIAFLGCLKKVDQVKVGPTKGCCFFCNFLHSLDFLNFVKILKSCKLMDE